MRSGGIGAEAVVFPGVRAMWTAEFDQPVFAAKGRQSPRHFFGDPPGFRKGRDSANHLGHDDVATAGLVNTFLDAPPNQAFLNIATRQIDHQGDCEKNADDRQHNLEVRSGGGSLRTNEHFGDIIHDGLSEARYECEAKPAGERARCGT
jgi:hypothetical protein